MNKDVKRKIIIIAQVILFSATSIHYSVTALGFNIDGFQNNQETANYELHFLKNPNGFNNDTVFAYIRASRSVESNELYLCAGIEFEKINDPMLAGMKLSVNAGPEITLMANASSEFDSNLYYVKTASSCDTVTKNMIIESLIGIKNGLPEEIILTIKIIDTESIVSNTFTVKLESKEQQRESTTDSQLPSKTKDNKSSSTAEKTKSTITEFPYNLAQKSDEMDVPADYEQTYSQTEDRDASDDVTADDFTAKPVSKKNRKRNIYAAVGAVCAFSIATAAVISARRKSINANIAKTKENGESEEDNF